LLDYWIGVEGTAAEQRTKVAHSASYGTRTTHIFKLREERKITGSIFAVDAVFVIPAILSPHPGRISSGFGPTVITVAYYRALLPRLIFGALRHLRGLRATNPH
jgi:hypothetical protein